MQSVKLGELSHALDKVKADGTARSASDKAGLSSTSTVVTVLDSPTALTGARDDPEEALLNLIGILATLGWITDGTTAT